MGISGQPAALTTTSAGTGSHQQPAMASLGCASYRGITGWYERGRRVALDALKHRVLKTGSLVGPCLIPQEVLQEGHDVEGSGEVLVRSREGTVIGGTPGEGRGGGEGGV